MSLGGKRDGFVLDDFVRCAETVSMKRGRAASILDEVCTAVAEWPFAEEAGVEEREVDRIARAHRLDLKPKRSTRTS